MAILVSLLVLVLALACGLANRFAGGLLSKLVGKDLGDFLPRLVWGITSSISAAIISIISDVKLASDWYFWLSIIVIALLMTVARGFGWGSSLTVGFQKDSDHEHSTFIKSLALKQDPMFLIRAMAMTVFVMAYQAFIHDSSAVVSVTSVILSTVSVSLGWLGAYTIAFLKPLNIPKLGMLNNTQIDPPPTGEFYSGILLVIVFAIAAFI